MGMKNDGKEEKGKKKSRQSSKGSPLQISNQTLNRLVTKSTTPHDQHYSKLSLKFCHNAWEYSTVGPLKVSTIELWP